MRSLTWAPGSWGQLYRAGPPRVDPFPTGVPEETDTFPVRGCHCRDADPADCRLHINLDTARTDVGGPATDATTAAEDLSRPTDVTGPSSTATGAGPSKVLVVIEENHTATAALQDMPFLASLATAHGQATNYRAVAHPSLPNYLAIAGGSTPETADRH